MASTLSGISSSTTVGCSDHTGTRAGPSTHAAYIRKQSFLSRSQGSKKHQNEKLLSRRAPVDRCPQRKVQALGSEELTQGIEKGTKIRVTKPVTVFHAPKLGNLKLEGHEGTVVDIVQDFKGKKLSANLPYKVEFRIPADDKDVKVIAHLAAPEIEAAS